MASRFHRQSKRSRKGLLAKTLAHQGVRYIHVEILREVTKILGLGRGIMIAYEYPLAQLLIQAKGLAHRYGKLVQVE
jgi:hypothetical protein